METKDANIKTLVKLGVDVADVAELYDNVSENGQGIEKEKYINNLTEKLKFFQTRNKGMDETEEQAIYKEDVLNMLKSNKNLIGLDIENEIKPICEKLDKYYFMNSTYTNKLIKNNSNIFNINEIDLETYSAILSQFAIKIDEKIVNLYEYVIKQDSNFLNQNVQKVYQRIMYIKNTKNSKLLTKEDLFEVGATDFTYQNKVVDENNLKAMYELPKYQGEEITEYKNKILKNIE